MKFGINDVVAWFDRSETAQQIRAGYVADIENKRAVALEEIKRLRGERDHVMPALVERKLKAAGRVERALANLRSAQADYSRASAECGGRETQFMQWLNRQEVILLNLPMPESIDAVVRELESAKVECGRLLRNSPSIREKPMHLSQKQYDDAVAAERGAYVRGVRGRVEAINSALQRARDLRTEPVTDLVAELRSLRELPAVGN